jgi:hypothetical protein
MSRMQSKSISKWLSIFFLNGKIGNLVKMPSNTYLNGHPNPNIVIFYSRFFTSQIYIEDENGSLECA